MAASKAFWYHLMAIVTVAIWGTTFVSTKILIYNGLTPVDILAYRFTIAYICIWFISPKKLFCRNLKDELWTIAAGLTGGSLYFITENTALGITLASNVSLILCTTPVLVTILSKFINREAALPRSLWTGSLIALAGVALVVFNGSFVLKISPVGDLLTLTSALMWAFYCLILRRQQNLYPTIFITRKVFFYGVVTLIPFTPWLPIHFNTEILSLPVVYLNLLFLGMIASMACFIMWNLAVKEIGALYASHYIYIAPLVTMITSSLIINEHITLIAIMGSVLILLGVYLAERKKK